MVSNSKSRRYLVLGASGSTGAALCKRLKFEGARVVAAGRPSERLEDISGQLEIPQMEFDARDPEQVKRVVDQAVDTLGGLDGVANCVGSLILKPAHRTTDEEFHETIAVNLTSSFATIRAAAPAMKQQGGSIVLVSTAAARVGLPNHEAIAAAKAGVIGLAQSAAATYANWGVRVNAVAPGLVRSRMSERIWSNELQAQASLAMHALGRFGEPDEIAAMIAWLLGPDATWATGQVFGIDGGLSMVRPLPPKQKKASASA